MNGRLGARLQRWVRRYGPAEILSVGATLGGVGIAHAGGLGPVGTALAGTWAGNVAYFGWIGAADIRQARRAHHAAGQSYGWRGLAHNLRALAVEFGPAEVFDSLLIRPALLYWLPLWLHSLAWGTLAAKLAADITFYLPTIVSYELSRRHLRRWE